MPTNRHTHTHADMGAHHTIHAYIEAGSQAHTERHTGMHTHIQSVIHINTYRGIHIYSNIETSTGRAIQSDIEILILPYTYTHT